VTVEPCAIAGKVRWFGMPSLYLGNIRAALSARTEGGTAITMIVVAPLAAAVGAAIWTVILVGIIIIALSARSDPSPTGITTEDETPVVMISCYETLFAIRAVAPNHRLRAQFYPHHGVVFHTIASFPEGVSRLTPESITSPISSSSPRRGRTVFRSMLSLSPISLSVRSPSVSRMS
jgi:hypothetical protein